MPKLEPLILLGAGGHTRACIDVIETENRFRIVGIVGLPEEVGRTMFGYPVVGTDADLPGLRQQAKNAIVTLGQIKTPKPRIRLFEKLAKEGFHSPAIVSPRAHVSRHANVGIGTIVMHGAIVNAGAKVGPNCIINSNALVEHDSVVTAHCHISTAAVINGGVYIDAGVFIGSGSIVKQGVTVGENSFIAMGQNVICDCSANSRVPPKRNRT